MRIESKTITQTEIIITMALEEAEVLMSVVGCICGDTSGPRATMDRLYEILKTRGISPSPTAVVTNAMQLDQKGGE